MRRLQGAGAPGKRISIDFEDRAIEAIEGEPVACSLVAAGELVFSRSVKYHRPRGPYCFSGACTHCLMRVDGVPNVFTCQTPARPGMRIERQNAFPSVRFDVFAATDWLFPRGLDHHEMFAGVPVAERVMLRVARHLAGLGLLPDKPAAPLAPAESVTTRVAIVGAGAAGLASAEALSRAGIPYLLVDREPFPGGRLVRGAPVVGDAQVFAPPPASLRLRATALALYQDGGERFLAVSVGSGDDARLLSVRAERFLLAPGGVPAMIPFANNDAPGVIAGRAASFLVRRAAILPGETIALVGTGDELYALARLLSEHGAQLSAIVDIAGEPPPDAPGPAFAGQPLAAHGRGRVRRLTFEAGGQRRRVPCDAVVISVPPSPSFELARQGGAQVTFDPQRSTFVVTADDDGRTANPAVFVAGDVRGGGSVAQARASGARAAAALIASLPPSEGSR